MRLQKRLRHRCDESEMTKLYHAVSPWQLTYDVATDIRRARWHLTWQLLHDKAADIRRDSWHMTWHLLYDVAADIRRGCWHRKWNDTNVHVADSLQSEVVFKRYSVFVAKAAKKDDSEIGTYLKAVTSFVFQVKKVLIITIHIYTERIACILCMHLGACRFLRTQLY